MDQGAGAISAQQCVMKKARPIWLKGLEHEMNMFAGFRTVVAQSSSPTMISIAASNIYRLSVNGAFICHGPARTAHDFYRVDVIDITKLLNQQSNVVAIEVAAYNINSYYVLNQPGFLQAEILSGRHVVAATGNNQDFAGLRLKYRVQKAERYSFQRCFAEVYALDPGYDQWKANLTFTQVEDLQICKDKELIVRRAPLPVFPVIKPVIRARGAVERQPDLTNIQKGRYIVDISDKLLGFKEQELQNTPSIELQHYTHKILCSDNGSKLPLKLKGNEFAIFELVRNSTGFIKADIKCDKQTQLYFIFDEVLTGDDIDFLRLDCTNTVAVEMEPGSYTFESFEPYTMKYLKVLITDGDCTIDQVALRELKSPMPARSAFDCGDDTLNDIYEACIETFRQNATDIFMDCPSRERAGWLCDSFFMARISYELTGTADLETDFLENFALAKAFPKLPEGALPMCYPADHYDGVFIPNWPLWLILELKEYAQRNGSTELVEKLRPRLFRYIEYLSQYENSDGLLEDLPGWIFVEWSKANEFVKDVNYPTNMLYAAALECLGTMFTDSSLITRAEKLRAKIHEQSFDGKYFADNAVRENGKLRTMPNYSETCQYYAFYFGLASRQNHAQLWNEIENNFGPNKSVSGVHSANAFIGFYLRLDLLLRYGAVTQMQNEIKEYFSPMAQCTGTLWEHKDQRASCCHGFASYIAYLLRKACVCAPDRLN